MTPTLHPRRTARLGQRAVVMGASLAGLLAARVLRERFDEVVLLERDTLPEGALPRKGTPHAVHPHGLLARGREVIEQLFPGFSQALIDQGALSGDLQRDVAFDADRARFALGDSGHMALAVSRLAIEAEIRRRVLATDGVRAVTGVDVIEPLLDASRRQVTGVRYTPREEDGPTTRLAADLVVDCTGRGSRLPRWLATCGFAPPEEEEVPVGICYASAYYRRDGEFALGPGLDKAALICTATPALPRPATMIAQEPGPGGVPRWVVGLGGYAGDHPADGDAGLRERALQVGSPELIKLTQGGQRLGEVLRYNFSHSQRRHYEQLVEFPAGLLVMGDALASFNPIYGQGMTVAACEALALRRALVAGLHDVHRRFFRAASKIVDTPWQLAVGGDLAIESVPGPRPLSVRLINRWVACLYRVAPHDPVVARAFLKVVHLVAPPASLFAPALVLRVLLRLGGQAAPAATPPARAETRTA